MLFEGLYHPPNMTPDGMRGRGGEGREALDTSRMVLNTETSLEK